MVRCWGAAGALGFALGAAVSFGNAWWMHRVSMSIGAEGEKARQARRFSRCFRY